MFQNNLEMKSNYRKTSHVTFFSSTSITISQSVFTQSIFFKLDIKNPLQHLGLFTISPFGSWVVYRRLSIYCSYFSPHTLSHILFYKWCDPNGQFKWKDFNVCVTLALSRSAVDKSLLIFSRSLRGWSKCHHISHFNDLLGSNRRTFDSHSDWKVSREKNRSNVVKWINYQQQKASNADDAFLFALRKKGLFYCY
jgi:hypothetical protein